MKRRNVMIAVGLLGAVALGAWLSRGNWTGQNASAQAPPRPRVVAVDVAKAERLEVPIDVD